METTSSGRRKLTIRRRNGNKDAWGAFPDIRPSDHGYVVHTAMTLDALVSYLNTHHIFDKAEIIL